MEEQRPHPDDRSHHEVADEVNVAPAMHGTCVVVPLHEAGDPLINGSLSRGGIEVYGNVRGPYT